MRLFDCDCRPVYRKRVRRSPWMKVLSARRLYHCLGCDAILLVRPVDPDDVFQDTVPLDPGSLDLEAPVRTKPA